MGEKGQEILWLIVKDKHMSDLKGIKLSDGGFLLLAGVGATYAESGLPLAEIEKATVKRNVKVAWVHVADEFLRLGFSPNRVVSEFRELVRFRPDACDIHDIEALVSAEYSDRQVMKWQSIAPYHADIEDQMFQLCSL